MGHIRLKSLPRACVVVGFFGYHGNFLEIFRWRRGRHFPLEPARAPDVMARLPVHSASTRSKGDQRNQIADAQNRSAG